MTRMLANTAFLTCSCEQIGLVRFALRIASPCLGMASSQPRSRAAGMCQGLWRLMPERVRPAPGQGREATGGWPFASHHENGHQTRRPLGAFDGTSLAVPADRPNRLNHGQRAKRGDTA